MPQAADLAINAGRFRRHIRAVGLSPRVEAMARFLAERGMPLDIASITREHLEEWLIAEHGQRPPVARRHLGRA
jgi:hypothetical protein